MRRIMILLSLAYLTGCAHGYTPSYIISDSTDTSGSAGKELE